MREIWVRVQLGPVLGLAMGYNQFKIFRYSRAHVRGFINRIRVGRRQLGLGSGLRLGIRLGLRMGSGLGSRSG